MLEERDPNMLVERIFVTDPQYPPTQIEDVLMMMAKAASTNKVLMMDARYGDCLGCMNHHYNSYIGRLIATNQLMYSVVDFTDISGRNLGQTARRPPYSRIHIEPAYKFFQALTFNRIQVFNGALPIESYPLVAPAFRDHEPAGIQEDQANRVFTRGHFPNLVFIDGGKINKAVLNRMCFFHENGRQPMSFAESSEGISFVRQEGYRAMVENLLQEDAVLMQLIGPNLYYSGSETAEDFAAPETQESIECILNLHHWDVQGIQQCKKFLRPGFPY